MNIDLPQLSDFPDDPNGWMLEVEACYSDELEKCRAKKDEAGRQTLLQNLRAAVEQALELGLTQPWGVQLLARYTTDPQERLRYYSITYKNQLADPLTEWGFDEQAIAKVEAATYLRQMGLVHEGLGDAAQAADCFTRALTHLQEASDLFETHCLSEHPHNSEEETFPLRPRLVTELQRVKNRLGKRQS